MSLRISDDRLCQDCHDLNKAEMIPKPSLHLLLVVVLVLVVLRVLLRLRSQFEMSCCAMLPTRWTWSFTTH